MNEKVLLDTNILTALRDEDNARQELVVGEVARLRPTYDLHVAPQSFYEFWVVSTRPRAVNGLNWSIEEATLEIAHLRRIFTVLPDPSDLLDEWLDFCRTHGVSGKNARDFARFGLNVAIP